MNAPLDVLVTPITGGTLTVVAADGVVVASGYDDDVVARIPAALQARGTRDVTRIDGVSDAIEAYEAGDVGALDAGAGRPAGRRVLPGGLAGHARRSRRGRRGATRELAAKLGKPKAVRAAGSACARNNVAPFVPCHRILRSDGSLGGYAYGLPVKRALLDHEGCSTS